MYIDIVGDFYTGMAQCFRDGKQINIAFQASSGKGVAQGVEVCVFHSCFFQKLVVVFIEGCITQSCGDPAGKNIIILRMDKAVFFLPL